MLRKPRIEFLCMMRIEGQLNCYRFKISNYYNTPQILCHYPHRLYNFFRYNKHCML